MENLVFSYAGSDRQVRRTASHSHRGWELLYIVSGSCRIRFFPDKDFDGSLLRCNRLARSLEDAV